MNQMLPIYTARWEMEAAAQNQRHIDAQRTRLACVSQLANKARRSKEGARREKSALRRLFTSPAQAGGHRVR